MDFNHLFVYTFYHSVPSQKLDLQIVCTIFSGFKQPDGKKQTVFRNVENAVFSVENSVESVEKQCDFDRLGNVENGKSFSTFSTLLLISGKGDSFVSFANFIIHHKEHTI